MSSSMFCSMAPFSLRERTCNTYPWMEFDLHGHNRTAIEPGIVGTAINGTIRLQSDFEVRHGYFEFCLIPIFIILYFWQLARDPRTACTWQSFARELPFLFYMYSSILSERMDFQSTTNWWSIHLLLPSSKWVSWVRPTIIKLVIDDVSSEFILTTNHALHS